MGQLMLEKWRRMNGRAQTALLLVLAMLGLGAATWWGRAQQGPDRDGDGMNDDLETFFRLDSANPADAVEDPDGDGLSNAEELALPTDPFVADTDCDGIPDGADKDPRSRAVQYWDNEHLRSGNSYRYVGPAWWLGAYKVGGEWTSEGWKADQDSGYASLNIAFDRAALRAADLTMTVEFEDTPGADLRVGLLDAAGRFLVEDLSGNLAAGSGEVRSATLILPVSRYPEAVCICLRRLAGTVLVGETIVYPDAADNQLIDEEKRQSAGQSTASTSQRQQESAAAAGAEIAASAQFSHADPILQATLQAVPSLIQRPDRATARAEALSAAKDPGRRGRHSVLSKPEPFDVRAYAGNPSAYLKEFAPGRCLQSARPGKGTARLRNASPLYLETREGGAGVLPAVWAGPGAPVTFTSLDLGQFENGLTSITVAADERGQACVRFEPSAGTKHEARILAACPLMSGQVEFTVNIREISTEEGR